MGGHPDGGRVELVGEGGLARGHPPETSAGAPGEAWSRAAGPWERPPPTASCWTPARRSLRLPSFAYDSDSSERRDGASSGDPRPPPIREEGQTGREIAAGHDVEVHERCGVAGGKLVSRAPCRS